MGKVPSPKYVELEGEYYHIRFRDPDAFTVIRTPAWASEAAESISTNAKVRTGRQRDSDTWVVQSILIPKAVGKRQARSQAQAIIEKIEA